MTQQRGEGAPWPRWLAGCALGCGALILIFAIVSLSFYFWAATPGPQIETEVVIGTDSLGFVRLQNLAEDEGVGLFLLEAIQLADRNRRRQLEDAEVPFVIKWLFGLGRSPESQVADIRSKFPRAVTVTAEMLPDQEPQLVLAANLAKWPRFLKLSASVVGFFRGVETHGEHAFQSFEGAGNLAFVKDTVLWTGSGDVIRVVLDRIEASTTGDSLDNENARAFQALAPKWDLFGYLQNRSEFTAWALELIAKLEASGSGAAASQVGMQEIGPYLNSVEILRFGFDIVSENTLHGEVLVRLEDEGSAQAWEEMIRVAVEDQKGAWEGVTLSAQRNVRDVNISLHTDELMKILDRAIQDEERK